SCSGSKEVKRYSRPAQSLDECGIFAAIFTVFSYTDARFCQFAHLDCRNLSKQPGMFSVYCGKSERRTMAAF
ncbi:hypothetical protein, partial [Cronobacter sakazakii]|uniref:hypothetical protein n=1 Tax=Cronobacter sakazakii TaxID=28141 RepID=UPI00195AEDCB